MQLALSFNPQFHYEQMALMITTDAKDIVRKLFAAIEDGRLKQGHYDYLDGELVDDDGVSWINAEVRVGNWDWAWIGANDDTGEIYISTGLKYDPLDGVAGPITDADAYWLDFVEPLRQVLKIIQ